MSTNPSTLPWIWTIEALASFNQVDPSFLIDLVKRTPEISDDVGRNAREMVSFRILESLFGKKVGEKKNGGSGAPGKIGFDPSERCEDVLRRILDESSGSKLGMAESEMSKWDVQPFIMHKRSRSPKCALQQLKDMILQESHPLLSSLKKKSELVMTKQSENITPVNGGDSNGLAQRLGDALNGAEKGNLVSQTRENGGEVFQETLVGKNLLPTKRDRNGSVIENHMDRPDTNEDTVENGFDLLLNAAKKLKQQDGQNSVSLSETAVVGDANLSHNEQRVPCNDDNVPQDTSVERNEQNIGVDEAKEDSEACAELRTPNEEATEKCERVSQPNVSNGEAPVEAKDDMEKTHEDEIVSDSDGYNDERSDIVSKKHAFLSSQYSQDSMATIDFTELNLCMKCNKGGELLVCNSDVCPLVVHESCLGSSATFDVGGKFYCPFCAYSRSISEYLDLKKNVSSAKKNLMEFIGLGTDCGSQKTSKRLRRLEKNQPRQDEDLNKSNEINNNGRENTEDMLHAEPPISFTNNDPPCGEKGTDKKCQSPRRIDERESPEQAVHECEVDNSSRRDKKKTLHGSGVLHKPVNDSTHEPVGPSGTDDIEACSEEENDKSGGSNYSTRFQKKEKQYTYPAIPMLRRKTLRWSKIEEDTLKEGVEKFSDANDRNIPWKKILEFGKDAFLKGRTTIDLKDKWRNICKGTPKSK